MAYIKISDPNILDLAAWHQVINVVNQHSDSIDAITNNFGASSTPDWNAEDYSHQFEPGSQQILYGRAKSTSADTTNNGTLWYNTITFTDTAGVSAFSSQPVVTATAFSGSTSNAVSSSNEDIIVSVYNVTATGFKYRLYRANGTNSSNRPITGTVYVNWMAIGPKG